MKSVLSDENHRPIIVMIAFCEKIDDGSVELCELFVIMRVCGAVSDTGEESGMRAASSLSIVNRHGVRTYEWLSDYGSLWRTRVFVNLTIVFRVYRNLLIGYISYYLYYTYFYRTLRYLFLSLIHESQQQH